MYNEELSNKIYQRHYAQKIEDISALRSIYQSKVIFGKIKVSELFLKLKDCYDITDMILYDINQYDHALQTYAMMLKEGVDDKELLIAALVHDVGKVALDEKPENLFCANMSVNELPKESPKIKDLDFHFGHDEIAYIKLKDHCSEKISFIMRYHSSRFTPEQEEILSESDPENFKLLQTFLNYDLGSKDREYKPDLDEEKLVKMIDDYFPEEIVF
jgi:hypothetical protein